MRGIFQEIITFVWEGPSTAEKYRIPLAYVRTEEPKRRYLLASDQAKSWKPKVTSVRFNPTGDVVAVKIPALGRRGTFSVVVSGKPPLVSIPMAIATSLPTMEIAGEDDDDDDDVVVVEDEDPGANAGDDAEEEQPRNPPPPPPPPPARPPKNAQPPPPPPPVPSPRKKQRAQKRTAEESPDQEEQAPTKGPRTAQRGSPPKPADNQPPQNKRVVYVGTGRSRAINLSSHTPAGEKLKRSPVKATVVRSPPKPQFERAVTIASGPRAGANVAQRLNDLYQETYQIPYYAQPTRKQVEDLIARVEQAAVYEKERYY